MAASMWWEIGGSPSSPADPLEGLLAYDVTNPFAPRSLTGEFSARTWGGGLRVAATRSLVYVATDSGMEIFDAAAPPIRRLGRLYLPGRGDSLGLAGGRAVVASYYDSGYDFGFILGLVDVRNPRRPRLRSTRLGSVLSWQHPRIAVRNEFVYVLDGITLSIFSLSGSHFSDGASSAYVGSMGDLAVTEGTAFLALEQDCSSSVPGELVAFDTSQPGNPRRALVPTPAPATSIAVREGWALIGTRRDARLFDVHDPGAPRLKRVFTVPEGANDVALTRRRSYVLSAGAFRIFPGPSW